MSKEMAYSAEIAIRDCMAVKPGENVLVIADEPSRTIGRVLWEKAIETGAEAVYIEMTPRRNDGVEPPHTIAAAMKQADVIFAPTSRSLSHTVARKEANQAGARIATLPGITEDMMKRTLSADYQKIAAVSAKFAEILSKGKVAHLTTPLGTDVTLSLEGREAHPDTGIIHQAGDFSNLPAGEAFIAPLEGTANGVIIVDGAMSGIGVLKAPIKMTVEKGYVTKIEGDEEAAKKLDGILSEYGKLAYNIAELGIGTNDKAILTGKVLEDEKVMGTVHIALGNSASFGGTTQVSIHLDGIITRPTLTIDGQVVIKDGQHMI